jgi:hypothetical protein
MTLATLCNQALCRKHNNPKTMLPMQQWRAVSDVVSFVLLCICFAGLSWHQQAHAQSSGGNRLRFESRWTSSLPPQGGGGLCESIAFDATTQRLFVANSLQDRVLIEVVDFSNPLSLSTLTILNLSPFGADVSSIAVSNGVLAAAMIQNPKTDSGRVVFIDISGGTAAALQSALTNARSVRVGAQPDMIAFTPDGRRVLTANEGEPNETGSYFPDPEGSVSIIDLPFSGSTVNLSAITQANVRFVRFHDFNFGGARRAELGADSLRLHLPSPTTTSTVSLPDVAPGRLVTLAQDLEPEYITFSSDSRTAYVTLQENNAWAIIDIEAGRVRTLRAMGFKDHSRPAFGTSNGFDASDQSSAIRITNWPVFGMYQPDALATVRANNRDFIVSVNEGDSRGWASFNEEIRVGAAGYVLDPTRFPARDSLKRNTELGRLTVTRSKGDVDGDGDFDEIYVFGGRSIAVWDDAGNLVWDSGDQLEQITARQLPMFFNASRDNVTLKNRSDDKGPEPEGIIIGTVGDSTYCYAGLERTSGIVVFNVSNPSAPRFVQYISSRDYSRAISGDVSTEAILFIPASQNRLRRPLVVAAHEVSGTVAVYTADNAAATSVQAASNALEHGVRIRTLSPTEFVLDIPTFGADAVQITVVDMAGNSLHDLVLTGTAGYEQIHHSLNFTDKPSGTYIVVLRCAERVLSHKIAVTR